MFISVTCAARSSPTRRTPVISRRFLGLVTDSAWQRMKQKREMRRSLSFRLVLAFLAVSVIAVVLVAVSSAAVTAFEFNRLVTQEANNSFVAYVGDYYNTHGS